ncbi:hypothetical protein JNW88_06275 [Micromonospora sp. ATA32]|nr:hypothetical protein [Micromonospora sp. ATA32]
MFKIRAFGDELAKDLVRRTGVKPQKPDFFHRVHALYADGTLVPDTYHAFDRLPDQGNKAVHDHLGEVRAALDMLRTCFELGVWSHRPLTGDRTPIGFVPPTPPARQVPQSLADGLQAEIQRYKDELAQTLLLAGKPSLAQAQADATVAADRAVRDADARRDQAVALVASLETAAQAARATLDSEGTGKVSAARREDFIARARRASHEPLNEMQTRVEIDRQLGAAGWVVQDESQINPFAGTGVAVREVTLATGRADYLLYVDQRLVGVIEAKRGGTGPRRVAAQLDRYLNGLTTEQKLTAWHRDDPLPFGYVATGTETAFVNRLEPFPRTREVFAIHRPETLARWMREADTALLPVQDPLRFAGHLGGGDRRPHGEELTEVRAVHVSHRRILLDDVEFVDDAEVDKGLDLNGAQRPELLGEAVEDLVGHRQVPPAALAVAGAVEVDQRLGVLADKIAQGGPVGPVEQGEVEAVRAVDGVSKAGQLRGPVRTQRGEALLHSAQMRVERATGVADRLGATLAQPSPGHQHQCSWF